MAVVSCLLVPRQETMQKILWIALALLGAADCLKTYTKINLPEWVKITDKSLVKLLVWFIVPFVFSAVYSPIICCITGSTVGTALQSVSTAGYVVVDFLMTLWLINTYKTNSLRLLASAVILSYLLTALIATSKVGVSNVLAEIGKDGQVNLFESHDVGTAVVPLLMTYIYFLIRRRDWHRNLSVDVPIMMGLVIVLVMCGKRSAYLSLLTGFMVLVVLNAVSSRKRTHKWLTIIACLSVYIACFIYVGGIRLDYFSSISDGFGTLSDRYFVWKWFDGQYIFSLQYIGKGFGYIHQYMMSGAGPQIVTDYNYLHNSILQIYIEMGFIGFTIWFAVYLLIMPVCAVRTDGSGVNTFVVASIIAMISMFTIDNTLTYPVYQVCLMTSIGCVHVFERAKRRE